MVIIRITGGLGNQMFQYAAGRAAALRTNTKLVLNTAFFDDGHSKQLHETKLHLDLFPAIRAQHLATASAELLQELQDASRRLLRRNADRVLRRLGLTPSLQEVRESQLLTYEPTFHTKKGAVLNLMSDWQNERYFTAYESTIRADFTFPKIEGASVNDKLLASIQCTNSVSIHVRRGDYLSSGIHQPTAVIYYQRAIELVQSRLQNPTFFVFSDDITWCQANLGLVTAHYIDHNTGENSYLDMQLMSNCKHNIIANSSFSWWGAWLNRNQEKIVIAPEIWLAKISIKSDNVVPEGWIILSCS